jgi:hypothetical protein
MAKHLSRICPICNKEILETDLAFYVPFEVPYLNIKIHREHIREFGGYRSMFSDNLQMWYNILDKHLETKGNDKK